MTVVTTTQDPERLTLTVVAELAAPPARVWQVWADPRQLERWWGPPTWPATVEEHDFAPGGRSTYFMTGPDGEKARGWWRFTALDEPRSLEFEDGFSDEAGEPNPSMPVIQGRVDFEEIAQGTRMTITSSFASAEQMEQLVRMGISEGMAQAMSQLDEILAA
jgi:uncharacterized protein YndB with AHSA1/START domain